jgi:D-alanine-D-alanine ligase
MNNKIVLIADRVPKHQNITMIRNDLECVEDDYFHEIYQGLQNLSDGVIHYDSPRIFLDNISKHKSDIVLSIWSGKNSRNRKSLIPSICESYNICYIGADPYVHMIAQDKHLSKYFCENYGIYGSNGILIETPNQIESILKLEFPLVVKPNSEGGSIGISNRNLVDTFQDADTIIRELLLCFQQPVLVEEYIKGIEICVTLAGTNKHLDVLAADALEISGKSYLEHDIFSYETKKEGIGVCQNVPATHLLDDAMKETFVNLFMSMGKVEVIRIDGRIFDGKFVLIELSPDMHLGKGWSTATAFAATGYTYNQMLERLITNALETYKSA